MACVKSLSQTAFLVSIQTYESVTLRPAFLSAAELLNLLQELLITFFGGLQVNHDRQRGISKC